MADEGTLEQSWDATWAKSVLTACLERVRAEVDPDTFRAFEMVAFDQIPAAEVAQRARDDPERRLPRQAPGRQADPGAEGRV